MDNVLNKIKEYLRKRQAKKYTQEEVTEFIEARVKELEKETITHKKPR